MTKLSVIEAEARRLTGKTPEPRRHALQAALMELCETHWQELRGPAPAGALARALWSATPPRAELFVDLVRSGDARLAARLAGLGPSRALAMLVLAEIARGDAEGARIAYEAMMLSESPAAAAVYAEHIAAALRGRRAGPTPHPHAAREPLWRALATIVAHTGRHDLVAVTESIRRLTAASGEPPDPDTEALRAAVRAAGVEILAFDGRELRFRSHRYEHSPVTRKRLGDLVAAIRAERIA